MRFLSMISALLMGTASTQVAYADSSNFVIIDVRTKAEYESGHVKDALNIDLHQSDFQNRLAKLDKTKAYKLYCRSGNRSGQAERIMKELGFPDVENIGSVGQAAKKLGREVI